MTQVQRRAILVAATITAPLGLVAGVYALFCYLGPVDFEQRRDFVQLAIQILGGAVVLFGLYSAWRQILGTEKNLELLQEGQITDRFTRAVEQLGSDSLTVRLGGIYGLERIAKDSSRDCATVMEVLIAFVQDQAHWPYEEVPEDKEPNVSQDVQAVLAVIGRRPPHSRNREQRLRLTEVDLRQVKLADTHLDNLSLAFVHLEGAFLGGAHLTGALLDQVKMQRAILFDAHLEGATLIDVDLTDAWLERAHLEGTDLSGASGLTQAQIDSVSGFDRATKLPEGIRQPKWFEEQTVD